MSRCTCAMRHAEGLCTRVYRWYGHYYRRKMWTCVQACAWTAPGCIHICMQKKSGAHQIMSGKPQATRTNPRTPVVCSSQCSPPHTNVGSACYIVMAHMVMAHMVMAQPTLAAAHQRRIRLFQHGHVSTHAHGDVLDSRTNMCTSICVAVNMCIGRVQIMPPLLLK